ncbi:DNA polymerase I [Spiroplasma sabaudiense Ar-1343]|uniref:DNA polymerase I n=1 Tax=Spiroplasma sabaudiense Ar-1343 TaxID=1276257 RepID=W6AA70_9MOLU|nr:DNA polymerase I [Spiroplasma sabaudiense]AHI54088.1 DNA polymerase I [Spiroplasma sabaudiense Ar-1343]
MKNKKVLLVDGNSLIFRAYFASAYTGNILKTKSGIPTNAVYSFINMLTSLLNQNDYFDVVVAFDMGKKTFRHEKMPDYKAGRSKTPDELVQQFPIVREFLTNANISYYEIENIEADDIIGTISSDLSKAADFEIEILTSDKDMFQLINHNTKILIPKTGVSDLLVFGENELMEKWSVTPGQVPDLKGIMGDPSDNIKGVAGIGEKGATTLLQKFHSLEGIYENIDEIKGATQKKLIESKEIAFLSKEIATIKTDVEIPQFDIKRINLNLDNIIEFLNKYEMFTLIKRLTARTDNINLEEKINYQILKKWDKQYNADNSAIIIELLDSNYHKAELVGIAISNEKGNFILELQNSQNQDLFNWQDSWIDEDFQELLLSNNLKKSFYDLKAAVSTLNRFGYQVNLAAIDFDMMLVGYIKDNSLKSTFSNYIRALNSDLEIPESEEIFGKGAKKSSAIADNIKNEYLAKKSSYLYQTKPKAFKFLEEEHLLELYNEIDLKFAKLLFEIEKAGVIVDKLELKKQTLKIQEKINILESEIRSLLGEHIESDFNINSPKQIKELLFDRLQLPDLNKGSTDRETLQKLVSHHVVIEKILDHRKFSKLYSTYLKGFEKYIFEDGKVHTIYNQTLTATGRLSSIEPNLQNISIRDDDQKEVRKIFISSPKSVFYSFDYSQIELRVLAQLAPEKNLIKIFNENRDVHSEAAKLLFKLTNEGEISAEMRRTAKIFNFGIIYGLSDFGLANDLNISIIDAKNLIKAYFDSFSDILPYKQKLISDVKNSGYVTTLSKRRRYIYELSSSNYQVRQFGERIALNTPIQGTAADILKVAMISINERLQELQFSSKMVAQIHDEIIFSVELNEEQEVVKIIEFEMKNALQKLIEIMDINDSVKVNLEVSSSKGKNWFELK